MAKNKGERHISFHDFHQKYLFGETGLEQLLHKYQTQNPNLLYIDENLKASFKDFLQRLYELFFWIQKHSAGTYPNSDLLYFRKMNKLTGTRDHDPAEEEEMWEISKVMISSYHNYLQTLISLEQGIELVKQEIGAENTDEPEEESREEITKVTMVVNDMDDMTSFRLVPNDEKIPVHELEEFEFKDTSGGVIHQQFDLLNTLFYTFHEDKNETRIMTEDLAYSSDDIRNLKDNELLKNGRVSFDDMFERPRGRIKRKIELELIGLETYNNRLRT